MKEDFLDNYPTKVFDTQEVVTDKGINRVIKMKKHVVTKLIDLVKPEERLDFKSIFRKELENVIFWTILYGLIIATLIVITNK
jgi:hypothetical protein